MAMKRIFSILTCVMMLLTFAYAEGNTYTLVCPSGAPAVTVAKLAEKDPDHYRFIQADVIAAEFSNKAADFIIAPINAGAKLYKAGKSTYILAAVVTQGNLVFASQRENFTIDDIEAQKIILFGENTINASVALYVLQEKGIVPAEIDYRAAAAETQAMLMTDAEAIVLTAEPAVTAAKFKNDRITAIPLTEELNLLTGRTGYAQAGLFIKKETLEADPEGVKAYLEIVKENIAEVSSDPEGTAKAAVSLEILPNEKIATAAVPNCGITYIAGADAKGLVEFTAGIDLKQFGGEVPANEFYYAEK